MSPRDLWAATLLTDAGIGDQVLDESWKRLRVQWVTASELWKDVQRRHFEREFWSEFTRVVPATRDALMELGNTVAAAQRSVP
jgi:hypothetical protein